MEKEKSIKKEPRSIEDYFESPWYQNFNKARFNHLRSLNLTLEKRSILEVGAGVGDHTTFLKEFQGQITVTEPKAENRQLIKQKHPEVDVRHLDLNRTEPDLLLNESFDTVYCYGTLYHVKNPAKTLKYLAGKCHNLLLLETQVNICEGLEIGSNVLNEEMKKDPRRGVDGFENRPSRLWMMTTLRFFFPYVYTTIKQPDHDHFIKDWKNADPEKTARAIFIASKQKLNNPLLSEQLMDFQQ